jgi:hypothetical protein
MQRREETPGEAEHRAVRRFAPRAERGGTVQAIGDVLAELLTQHRARFPHVNVMVVETSPEAS